MIQRIAQIKALHDLAFQKLRRDGPSKFLKDSMRELWLQLHGASTRAESAFDREFGTNTDGAVPLWKLNIQSRYLRHGFRYQPSDPDFVRAALENLRIAFDEFVYIDVGSGKGRTLLVASEYPFRRVLGVEFSDELNSIALANIRWQDVSRRKCSQVSSILADAATFEFPSENLVLYLYNPFDKDVLGCMLQNLRASLEKNDREVYLIYSYPIFADLIEQSGFLDRVDAPADAAVYRHALKVGELQAARSHEGANSNLFGAPDPDQKSS